MIDPSSAAEFVIQFLSQHFGGRYRADVKISDIYFAWKENAKDRVLDLIQSEIDDLCKKYFLLTQEFTRTRDSHKQD